MVCVGNVQKYPIITHFKGLVPSFKFCGTGPSLIDIQEGRKDEQPHQINITRNRCVLLFCLDRSAVVWAILEKPTLNIWLFPNTWRYPLLLALVYLSSSLFESHFGVFIITLAMSNVHFVPSWLSTRTSAFYSSGDWIIALWYSFTLWNRLALLQWPLQFFMWVWLRWSSTWP